jgi:glycosyltransferase involved in cell wall biosynthesis
MPQIRTLVVVPAYNAEKTIGILLNELSRTISLQQILVVDDGSTDATLSIARRSCATVIPHTTNRGKGAALRTGFQYAAVNGFDGVITIDADLQHDPSLVPSVLSCAESGCFDLIIGTRHRDRHMPRLRIFANFVTSAVVSLFAGTLVRDSQSGYRWIRTSALKRIPLLCDRYDLESEILIRAGKAHMRIGEVRIPTIYGTQESFINPIIDGWRFLKLLVRSLFW